jgi:hypothetical protein
MEFERQRWVEVKFLYTGLEQNSPSWQFLMKI